MENQLHARDRVGVQDFVLLEDFKNPNAFVDNLRKRYQADLIYVSKDRQFLSIFAACQRHEIKSAQKYLMIW